MWIPQKRKVGAKIGMRPEPIMWRSTVGELGDPHINDIVCEISAVRKPVGA